MGLCIVECTAKLTVQSANCPTAFREVATVLQKVISFWILGQPKRIHFCVPERLPLKAALSNGNYDKTWS